MHVLILLVFNKSKPSQHYFNVELITAHSLHGLDSTRNSTCDKPHATFPCARLEIGSARLDRAIFRSAAANSRILTRPTSRWHSLIGEHEGQAIVRDHTSSMERRWIHSSSSANSVPLFVSVGSWNLSTPTGLLMLCLTIL
jgi:hypothetical protein